MAVLRRVDMVHHAFVAAPCPRRPILGEN